ncbi:MAG: peptidoglycan D,D-transpeptidase FtsI family protein [Thermomicrobiales bacterium]
MKRFVSSVAFVLLVMLSGYALWMNDRLTDGRWLVLLACGWVLLLLAIWPVAPRPADPQDRAMINSAIVFATIFAVLAVQLVRIQLLRKSAIAEKAGKDAKTGEVLGNPRLVNEDLETLRGSILDRNGEVIAKSVQNTGIVRRLYPDEVTAYVAGYFSPLLYGKTGLEASFDDELSGRKGANPAQDEFDDLLNRNYQGFDLHLTLDSALQSYSSDLLNDRNGAIVLLDVQSGAVRTLVSNPHFDPSKLFTADSNDRETAAAYWKTLTENPDRPLVLRATSGLVPPGSTFKTVTASAAIDSGTSNPDKTYTDNGQLEVQGHVIVEYNRPKDSIDTWTLSEGIAFSLNVVMAQVGLELGASKLKKYADRFGFGSSLSFDMPIAKSQLASSDDFLTTKPALADTAFGQGQLLVTPLQMAVIAATIANDGELMRPYLVERVAKRRGKTVRHIEPESIRRVMTSTSAGEVRDMMINAVTNGYVSRVALSDYTVGGKTGTAEVEGQEPHAWFIGFVGDPTPRFAIALMLEHGGTDLTVPLDVARQILHQVMTTAS